MSKLINPLLSLTAIVLVVALWVQVHFSTSRSDPEANSSPVANLDSAPNSGAEIESYRPLLEHDPPVPDPPADAVRDFETFLDRLKGASETAADSLVLHRDALDRAEQVFRNTVGVPDDMM